jgi:hypothetical protein
MNVPNRLRSGHDKLLDPASVAGARRLEVVAAKLPTLVQDEATQMLARSQIQSQEINGASVLFILI